MEIRARAIHYMQFPHNAISLTRGDFTYYVFKNGELRKDIAVEVLESPAGIYTFSFANDGDHEALWSLIAWQTSNTDYKYGESWIVRDNVVRTTVLDIQADIKSGVAGSSGGSAVSGSPGGSIGRT